MSKLEECKEAGPVTAEFMESQLMKGKGASPDVTRRLVGMVMRGDKFKAAAKPAAKKPTEAAAKAPRESKTEKESESKS